MRLVIVLFSLAQGFQVVVASDRDASAAERTKRAALDSPKPKQSGSALKSRDSQVAATTEALRASQGIPARYHNDAWSPLPGGASEALLASRGTIYVSLANIVHQFDYDDKKTKIRVQQHVRRLAYSTKAIEYEAEVWTSLATEFTSVKATFRFPVSSSSISSVR